jgi:hypothetical protein
MLISNLVIVGILLMLVRFFILYNLSWLRIVQNTKYFVDNYYKKFTLLEIKIPKEVTRSPRAMEFVIDVLHQGAEAQSWPNYKKIMEGSGFESGILWYIEKLRSFWSDRYLKGEKRMWFTLEIESRGGEIHFYISCQSKYKEIIKSSLYSQYPGIEVTEGEDYTDKIRVKEHGGEHDIWNAYLKKAGDGNKDYLPIKTYVDYELSDDPKEEHAIDPFVAQLESISNIKPDEHIWITYVIHSAIDASWISEGKKRIDKIMGIERYKEKDPEVEDGKASVGDIKKQSKELTKIPPMDKIEVENIYRSIGKAGFKTLCYATYIAPKGKVRGEVDQVIRNLFKPFNNQYSNSFKMQNHNSTQPWHEVDFANPRRMLRRRAAYFYLQVTRNPLYYETGIDGNPLQTMINRFKDYGITEGNKYLYGDFIPYFKVGPLRDKKDDGNYEDPDENGEAGDIFNVEELATLFHIPSGAYAAQKNIRVESAKAEPPVNLPM